MSAVFAAALVSGGLLSDATPAAADSYTGCLTPFGTITRLAPGDTPRGKFCPPRHPEIKLGSLSGLERVTTTEQGIAAGTKKVGTADCSAGKVPVGGGFDINPNGVDGDVIVMESGPYGDGPGVGWRVRADGSNTVQAWDLVINVFCVDVGP